MINQSFFEKGLSEAHDHTVELLAFGELGIKDPATVER